MTAESSAKRHRGNSGQRTSADFPFGNDPVSFLVITNDGSDENSERLITLKNIFAKQLPKMPKEYIVRLVMDRRHYSIALMKRGQAIGGICYRPYMEQKFAEIAFCAITASEQVKGYGTLVMNHLKQHVKRVGITHFLTYADNYAIGYFKKQGFSKSLLLPRERWYGYIKDYDGGTLMECYVHPTVDYTAVGEMLALQRNFVLSRINAHSREHVVYPGLGAQPPPAPAAAAAAAAAATALGVPPELMGDRCTDSVVQGDGPAAPPAGSKRFLPVENVPGVAEGGWALAGGEAGEKGAGGAAEVLLGHEVPQEWGALVGALGALWEEVHKHASAWPFHLPVDLEDVPDYLTIVKEPLDLSMIKGRLDAGHYHSKEALRQDLNRMIANCKLYNDKATIFYREADALQVFVDRLFSGGRGARTQSFASE